MASLSKRIKLNQQKVQAIKLYPINEALALAKECATARFPESLDVSIQLGVDPRKADQVVRGASQLPHGTGREVRVAVFAQGDMAKAAKDAGADIVGFEDLVEIIKQGEINFDVVIATPDAMRIVGQLGQILGPRGLMPNPKVGTVTTDVANAVKNVKGGQVRYKIDKAGIIHCTIGKASFEVDALLENLKVFVHDLVRLKPASSKGIYIRKVSVSSTMGPGITIDPATIL